MSSATIRNERCAVVLVEHEDEARVLRRLVENSIEIRGVEVMAFGDAGSAVVALETMHSPGGKLEGAVLIANVRGLLVLLAEIEPLQLGGDWVATKASVRLFLEDAIAGLAS